MTDTTITKRKPLASFALVPERPSKALKEALARREKAKEAYKAANEACIAARLAQEGVTLPETLRAAIGYQYGVGATVCIWPAPKSRTKAPDKPGMTLAQWLEQHQH
jgi:hypothetical protein